MSFLLPQALFALLLVPLLLAVYIWMQRRRRRSALRYASVSLVREAVGRGPGIRRHIPPALFLLAVAAMGLAFARPEVTMPVEQDTGTVILSVDVSGSMQATDVAPNRMEATKEALQRFVQEQPSGVEVGLVTFSDSASLVQPPTTDKNQVLRAIDRLQPQAGTNIGGGLQVAVDTIMRAVDAPRSTATATPTPAAGSTTPATTEEPTATVVLISDGESNVGPDLMDVAQTAAAEGVRVYTVGIGTPQGQRLTIRGQTVLTRLDESTLRGVADATGGRYLSAQDESQLVEVYDDLAHEERVEDETVEVSFLAAAGALLLSVVGGALSLMWFNRLP
ncbi:MAG: vWA domain-containing protein [Dehalococcoidia bacterium]